MGHRVTGHYTRFCNLNGPLGDGGLEPWAQTYGARPNWAKINDSGCKPVNARFSAVEG